jgi:hypothetical protein
VQADTRGGATDPGTGAGDDRGAQGAQDGRAGVERGQQGEHGPGDQERRDGQTRGVADAAGPRAQVVHRVEPADVREDRPAEADGERDDGKLAYAEPGGEGGDRSGDRTRDDVRREQLAAQLGGASAGRRLGRSERLG